MNSSLPEAVTFTVEKNRISRYFSKTKTRTFTLKPAVLGTLGRLCRVDYLMDVFNPEATLTPWQNAKVVSIGLLNGQFKMLFTVRLIAAYLLWKLKPEQLKILHEVVIQLANFPDFIAATQFLAIDPNPNKKQAA